VRAFSAEVFAFPAVTCCSDLLYSVRFRFLAQLPPVALISFHLLCQLISCRRLVFLCVLADLSAGLLTARVPACDFSSRSVLSLSCLLFCELGLVRPISVWASVFPHPAPVTVFGSLKPCIGEHCASLNFSASSWFF
jgi:hypothetical protein